jgi:uncharacterized protein
VKLEIKKSKLHGLGLFAGEDIPWGKFVIEYTGQKITFAESNRREKFYNRLRQTYVFEYDDKYDIDGFVGGNESRFINHSKTPNLCVIRERGKILFYSHRNIKKGEELTFDYGFEP